MRSSETHTHKLVGGNYEAPWLRMLNARASEQFASLIVSAS